MLKAILTEMRANDAFLVATLVATGHLDVNSSSERLEAVKAEMHSDLEAAGIAAPVVPDAPASAVVDPKAKA